MPSEFAISLDVLGVSQLPHIFLCRRDVLLRRSFYFLAELRSSRRCRGDSLFQMSIIHSRVRPRHGLLADSAKLAALGLFLRHDFLPKESRNSHSTHISFRDRRRLHLARNIRVCCRLGYATPPSGGRYNLVFYHACKLGCEGIVSKHLGSQYHSGRSADWIKVKNPASPAVMRKAEEERGYGDG